MEENGMIHQYLSHSGFGMINRSLTIRSVFGTPLHSVFGIPKGLRNIQQFPFVSG